MGVIKDKWINKEIDKSGKGKLDEKGWVSVCGLEIYARKKKIRVHDIPFYW